MEQIEKAVRDLAPWILATALAGLLTGARAALVLS